MAGRVSQIVFAVLLFAAISCRGAEPAPVPPALPEQTRKDEVRQQQIQTDSEKLAALWDAMLGEYERNGLSGSEAEAMKKLRNVISSLSEQEMRSVIELLQKSRGASNPDTAMEQIAGAWSQQKHIVGEMKHLLGEFDRTRLARQTAKALDDLSARATANLRKTVELQKTSQNPLLEPLLKASLEERQNEQASIDIDFEALIPQIENLKNSGSAGEAWKEVLPKAKEARPLVAAAAEALKSQALAPAIEKQRAARNAVRKLARMVAPEDAVKALREGEQKLNKLVDDQKALIRDSQQQPQDRDYDAWVKKNMQDPGSLLSKALAKAPVKPGTLPRNDPRVAAAFDSIVKKADADAAALEKREKELAETAKELRSDLEVSGTNTADTLKGADAPLQQARDALVSPDHSDVANLPNAIQSETEALGQMQAAQAALQKELAQTEKASKPGDQAAAVQPQPAQKAASTPPPSPLATLQDLQNQIRDIAGKEDQAVTEAKKQVTDAKKAGAASDHSTVNKRTEQNVAAAREQQALKKRTEQLQQRTANVSQPAAQALADAAGEMQKAQTMLADPEKRGQAVATAAKDLRNADGQLAREVAKIQQSENTVTAASKVADSLLAIIEAEQKLELATLAAIGSGAPAGAGEEIASRQSSIEKDLTALWRKNTMGSEASAALMDADREMKTARQKATKKDLAAADAAERNAIEMLYKARKIQAQRLAAAEQQLGKTPQAQPEDHSAAQYDLARAQAQIQQATQAMKPAQQDQQQGQQEQGQQAQQSGQKGEQAQQSGQKGEQAQQSGQKGEQARQSGQKGQQAQQSGQQGEQAQQSGQKGQQAQQSGQKGEQAQQSGQKGEPQSGQKGQQAQQSGQKGEQAQQSGQKGEPQSGQKGEQAQQSGQQGQQAQQSGQKGEQAQQSGQQGQQAQQSGQQGQQAQQGGQQGQQSGQQGQQAQQSGQQAAASGAVMEQAAQKLGGAASDVADAETASADATSGLQDALQDAEDHLAAAAQASQSGDALAAEKNAAAAQTSIAQAQAMLSQAQAGITPGSGQSAQPGAPADAKAGQSGQAAHPSQPGQGTPGVPSDRTPKSETAQQDAGTGGSTPQIGDGHKEQALQRGARETAKAKARFIGLPPRERAVIEQSQSEKYPEEYGVMVEQYMQNLSDTARKQP